MQPQEIKKLIKEYKEQYYIANSVIYPNHLHYDGKLIIIMKDNKCLDSVTPEHLNISLKNLKQFDVGINNI